MFTQYKVSLDNVIDLVDMLSLSSPPRSPEELEASWFSSRWAHLSFFTCSLRAAREKNWKRKGISSSFCATFANVQLAKASHMSSPHQFGRVTHKGMWFGGCYYNNLPHTWNSTHNLKNSKEATFHYRLKLCLISEPGHWPGHWSPGLFIKASNYLMNSKIILHLGVYFGWIYSFIKCKLLMLTLTLYQKKKKKEELEEIHFSSGHRPGSSQGGPVPFTGWLAQETVGGYTAWVNERRLLLEVRQAWVLGPFVAGLQCLYLDTPFLEKRNTKKLNYGPKMNHVHSQWGQILDKSCKKIKKNNPTATFKEPGANEGGGEQKQGTGVPPAHITA